MAGTPALKSESCITAPEQVRSKKIIIIIIKKSAIFIHCQLKEFSFHSALGICINRPVPQSQLAPLHQSIKISSVFLL